MLLFDIKRYAINDGPGIRTTLFLKGCPLRCVWCHNPESWSTEQEMLFKAQKCLGCNACGRFSSPTPPLDAEVCPTKALEVCGRAWTMDELMGEVEKERDVMQDSGGGVTLCGGEPLMHPTDILLILQELRRRGFHRAVDTSLYASWETVSAVARETELFLIDLKHMDDEQHRRFTGVSNEPILRNVRLLAESLTTPHGPKAIWFRIPLIEGINADEENIDRTARFIASLRKDGQQPRVHLLPYHDIGRDKHRRRGTTYNPDGIPMSTPSDDTIERCCQQFAAYDIETMTGG